MSINACIASRGHPDALKDIVTQTLALTVLPDTKIAIALDSDDPSACGVANELQRLSDKIIVSIADREDSLGAKYNRAAATHDANIYVMLADDEQIITSGWDKKIEETSFLFPDGIFCIYFGNTPFPSSMPAGYAVSRKLKNMMGFFLCPFFPFWWHDTTLHEIVQFIGRSIYVDIRMSYPYGAGKTRGMRDVNHWANLFALLRGRRLDLAHRIIDSPENLDSPSRKTKLKQMATHLAEKFHAFDASNRDPFRAHELETIQAYDAPNDERYQRIYQASQELIAEIVRCG